MTREKLYKTEEERLNAILESKRKYANKRTLCEKCNKIISQGDKAKHIKRWCKFDLKES